MHFEAGMTFDRYVIQGLLGEGGMGEVYRAFDSKLRRRVALKILRRKEAGTGPSDGATTSILREARAAAALDHPNAVAIFDVGEHEGVPFLAMELIRGRSIRQIIDHERAPMEQRVRWLIEIARALSKAHAAGIVHRDIKPENVMVSDDGVVKVLDFGLARRAPRSASGAQAPASSGLDTLDSVLIERPVGTPPYMSPEQLRGEPLDGRTDQFSWGVLAYQLLTGAVPWSRTTTIADVIGAVLHEGAERPRARNAEIPEDVDRVIVRALRKQREERFASMLELLAALGDAPPRSGPNVERPPSAAAVTTEEIVELLDSGSGLTGPSGQAPRSPFQTTATVVGEGSPSTEAPSSPAPGRQDAESGPRAPAASPPGENKPEPEVDVAAPSGAKRDLQPGPSIIEPPRQRSSLVRSLSRWIVLAAAMLGLAAVVWKLRPKPPPPSPPDAEPTSVASTAPAPTALLNLPPPAGCNAAATAAHQRGIQALHDGSWEQANAHFEQATSADPECGSALLRFVMTGYYNYPISRTREIYQRAVDLRASLSERDQALLDAMEPLVRRDPANLREYAERLRAASERFPGDSELATLAAIYAVDVEVASRAARRAIAVDPTYSDALQVMSRVLRLQGKNAEAMKTLEDCARIARNSVDCLRQRMTFLAADGLCVEVRETARTWIARDPKTTEGYWLLANALASEGASRTAVEEALRQAWDRLPAAERADKQAFDTALVAALFGDFRSAEQLTRELRARADVGADVEPRGRPTWLLADVLQETRRAPEAAKIAESFLERRAAWSTNLASPGTDVVFLLLEPRLLDAARRGRRLDASQIEAARASWARSLGGAGFSIFSGPVDGALLWAMGKAALVETPAEAEEALASMPPSLANLSEDRLRLAELGAHAGRTMLLGGRLDLSVVRLRDAASSCRALYDPILLTRSSLWLGQALEQRGDTEGACRAYNLVRRRWGAASPSSITAEGAAKRATALRCPAP